MYGDIHNINYTLLAMPNTDSQRQHCPVGVQLTLVSLKKEREGVTKNLVRGKNRSGRTNFSTKSGPAGRKMTPKFVRLIQNWSEHINTFNTWRLILFSVKMAYLSEEGDANSGDLVEEAYEYLVRNVPGGGKRSTQAMHTKKGSENCCEVL